jgi:hypothetical protein
MRVDDRKICVTWREFYAICGINILLFMLLYGIFDYLEMI